MKTNFITQDAEIFVTARAPKIDMINMISQPMDAAFLGTRPLIQYWALDIPAAHVEPNLLVARAT